MAQHLFQYRANHIYHPNDTKETIDIMLAGPAQHLWTKSLSNKWGRLAQDNKSGVHHTDTIDLFHKSEVLHSRGITYTTCMLDHLPLKIEPNRVSIAVDGDRLSYVDDLTSPAANLLKTKVLVNRIISYEKYRLKLMLADIKDHL